MSIIRAPRPQSNFYMLDKKISEDKRLSWAARGLLVFLLGKPDHWRLNVAALINETSASDMPLGRDGVYRVLKALKDSGYIKTVRHHDGKMDYFISEGPVTENPYEGIDPHTEKPDLEKPDQENPDVLVSTEKAVKIEKAVSIDCAALPLASAPEKSGPVQADLLGDEQPEKAAPAKKSKTAKPEAFDAMTYLLKAGVDSQVASDWLVVRKKKNLLPTLTVLQKLERDGAAAGLSLAQTVMHCAERGHAGFYPDRDTQAAPANRGGCFPSKQERAEAENARRRAEREANQSSQPQRVAFEALPHVISQKQPRLIGYGQQTDDVGF